MTSAADFGRAARKAERLASVAFLTRDVVGDIIAYEGGKMSDEETHDFFQYLVDSGMAYTLQGHYGRTANALLQAGEIE